MFVDGVTLQTLSSEGHMLDRMGFIGLWKIVVVKNLPFDDMRRVGKIPKLLAHRLFSSARYVRLFSFLNGMPNFIIFLPFKVLLPVILVRYSEFSMNSIITFPRKFLKIPIIFSVCFFSSSQYVNL